MKKITLIAIACLSINSFAQQSQLPTLRVATKNNATPGYTTLNNNNRFCPSGTYSANVMQQDANASTSGANAYSTTYLEATETELSGAADSRHNFKKTSSGKPNESDSVRRRGNSTVTVNKISFRLKFDKRTAMFDRPAEKSWALLANYYDPSLMQSAIAFYLGQKLNLQFTPHGYHVKLNLANSNRGVYLLTEQIQRSEASVNIDKEDGWLAEFDYHCAISADDQKRFYHTGSNRYNINVKIREPDLDDLPLNSSRQPDGTCLDFVKSDLNALLDKMKESSFPNNGYRDYIDLDSYAKYIMIQLFMDNQDFNGLVSSSTLLGSNYAYKNKGEKIKAGPLWDLDIACGSPLNMGFGGSRQFFSDYQEQMEPRNNFYKRLWEDPVFRFKYKKIWNDNKSIFESVNKTNGVIDSLTNLIASGVAGNVGDGVSNVTEQSYRQHTAKFKTWWGNRINSFGNYVNGMSNVASSDVAESAPAAVLVNSKRNCREAVSSSSKPSSSSVSVSSSSNTNSGSVTLSCTGLQSSVERGATIVEPTLTCDNGSQATNPNWTGRPQQNSSWAVSATTTTASYTISVTASCGSSQLSANCGTVAVVDGSTPIANTIVLENMPSNTKIEVYNLQGKRIYSGYSENSGILKIPVQTKGIYIIKTAHGTQRMVVK
ncbi:MAG: CotH kinase family protein [Fibromonadaceae bacterium]|jgi:hypothetical protein|nr:CotH kinase family protein [Fibromonadaceae bacterium]